MTAPPDTQTPRAQCYHRIHHLFTGAMAKYVIENRDLLENFKRVEGANSALIKLLNDVLATLDTYDITGGPA